MDESTQPILKACAAMGGQAELARVLGITPAAVNQWCKGARLVPAERCPEIERATAGAVRCEDLRPDVAWDVLREQTAAPKPPDAPTPPAPAAAREEPAPASAGDVDHPDGLHRRASDTNGDPLKKRINETANALARAIGVQRRSSDRANSNGGERGGR